MDFNDSPAEAEFRSEARTWLEQNATPRKEGERAQRASLYAGDEDALKKARVWQSKKADAGYAAITWPKEYGGMGGTPIQSVIYNQEEANYSVPDGYFSIGLGMCIPTMMAYASEEQLERYVRPALHGEEIWCQLFSEPSAGSDLAGIRTRSERDGDDWIINGQKVWTSGAHYSDYGILVTRSDPAKPKHKGLTYFFLNMKSPGVEVRPIKQITGEANFNEVFFTDVRIPDSQRLGEVGDGWKVSLTTLMNERLAIGSGTGLDYGELLLLARQMELETGPAIRNDAVRQKIAEWYVQTEGLKYTRYRTLTALSRGDTPGPESSIGKIVSGPKMQDLASFATDMASMGGIMMGQDAPLSGAFQGQWLGSAGFRIAGGTDEILRNIIAERVLGLPQDIRVDKTVPFNELPSGR
ncbi:MAG: acyl-CoA dehydrogenase family protein [Parvularculales bacterium]